MSMSADRETLMGLAERCEQAAGPDRELDRESCLAARNGRWISPTAVPAYTASLDAAMSLVPEGWRWCVDVSARGDHTAFVENRAGNWATPYCLAATPALALTAASLRAIASTKGQDDHG